MKHRPRSSSLAQNLEKPLREIGRTATSHTFVRGNRRPQQPHRTPHTILPKPSSNRRWNSQEMKFARDSLRKRLDKRSLYTIFKPNVGANMDPKIIRRSTLGPQGLSKGPRGRSHTPPGSAVGPILLQKRSRFQIRPKPWENDWPRCPLHRAYSRRHTA